VQFLKDRDISGIGLSQKFPSLRFMRYRHEDGEYFMLSNEVGKEIFDGFVDLPSIGNPFLYDAMENTVHSVKSETLSDGFSRVNLRLEPYESVVVCFGSTGAALRPKVIPTGKTISLSGPWLVSTALSEEYPRFTALGSRLVLSDMGLELPEFSGFFRYETSFELPLENTGTALVELEDAFEGVELWINGSYGGMKICPPYRFDISGLLKEGTNSLRLEVANTLDRRVRSIQGHSLGSRIRRSAVIEPSGLIGRVWIKF
jgi:hypothetical protein